MGQKYEWSDPGDPSSLDALNVATHEASSDRLVYGLASQGSLYLFGTKTTEVHAPTGLGGADAFRRIPGAVVSVGIREKGAAIDYEDSVFMVTDDLTIVRINGLSFQRISTPVQEQKLAASTPTDIFSYDHRGHNFVVFRYSDRPADVYDLTTGLWHERSSGAALGAWNVRKIVKRVNWSDGAATQIAFIEDGGIYEIVEGVDDIGTAITRTMRSRPLDVDGDTFRVSNFQLRCQPNATSYDVDLRHSRDGGTSWSTARTKTMTSGNRSGRLRWNGLGSGRLFQVEVVLDDDVYAPVEAEAIVEVA